MISMDERSNVNTQSIDIMLKRVRGQYRECHNKKNTALPRHQEEEETDTAKQAQIKQTYEKHQD